MYNKADFYYVGNSVFHDFAGKKPMFCIEHRETQMSMYKTGVFKGDIYCMDCRRIDAQIVRKRRSDYHKGIKA